MPFRIASRQGRQVSASLFAVLCFVCLCLPATTTAETTLTQNDATTHEGMVNITCLVNAEHTEAICNGIEYEHEEKIQPGTARFTFSIAIILLCICTAGLMSGLTLGLLGQDTTTLEILSKSGTPQEIIYANRILPFVRKHHLLLVTLLLCNAAAMEALPIFLDALVPATAAIIISVTAVLFFGEIIPQAICSRWGLAVGGNVYWLVWGVIGVTFPISWPISKLLDWILGHRQANLFKRNQLKHFVEYHAESEPSDDDKPKLPPIVGENGVPLQVSSSSSSSSSDDDGLPREERLTRDEVLIIKGAIDLKHKTVENVMTKLDDAAMIDANTVLNREVILKIGEMGHSRIPVYEGVRTNIIGMMLAKSLLLVDQAGETPLRSIDIRKLPHVVRDTPLYSMLNMFQTGRSHMAVVIADAQEAIGIITLEDVIEELIGEEIEDEMDLYRRDKYIERVRSSFDTRQRRSPIPYHANALEIPVVHMKPESQRPHRKHHHSHHHRRRSVGSSPDLRADAQQVESANHVDPELGLQVLDESYLTPPRRSSLDASRPRSADSTPNTRDGLPTKRITFADEDTIL